MSLTSWNDSVEKELDLIGIGRLTLKRHKFHLNYMDGYDCGLCLTNIVKQCKQIQSESPH